MNNEPRITAHPSTPPINTFLSNEYLQDQGASERKTVAIAVSSSDVGEREAAYMRALSPPQLRSQAPPSLRGPKPWDDVAAGEIDRAIYERGIAIDRDKLVALGCSRFTELLDKEHAVRSVQRVLFSDLSSWMSVQFSFAAVTPFRASAVPRRTTAEAFAGTGADKDSAATISGFDDLWKLTEHRQTVKDVLAFQDAFAALVLGHSLNIGSDGRVRSRLFAGGSGRKVALFEQWLPVLNGQHYKVKLFHPLWSIIAWVAGEATSLPDPHALATEWTGARAPSTEQIRLVAAVIDGFVRGLRSWALWQHVGLNSRQSLNPSLLEAWREQLSKRYPAIARFHEKVASYFWRTTQRGFGSTYEQFRVSDESACRAYLDKQMTRLLDQASMIAAQTIGKGCAARFDDWLLCEGKAGDSTPKKVQQQLAAAFEGAKFTVTVEDLP
jgi:hypothetical protein